MGAKFTGSLSDAGELVLVIQDFSLADVGEYKVIVENELGAVSQIIRMEMSGTSDVHIIMLSTDRVIMVTRWCQFVLDRNSCQVTSVLSKLRESKCEKFDSSKL